MTIKNFKFELAFLIFFVIIRLPSLGEEYFNTDVWKWKARTYDFGTGIATGNFEKTLQKYHPGVTLMWLGSAGVKLDSFYCQLQTCPDELEYPISRIFQLHLLQKLVIVLALGLISIATMYPLRKLFGAKYALLAMTLVTTEPFYYALSRTIHLEALTTSFMLASLVWLFYSQEKGVSPKKALALSGIFGGLAFLTKSSSLIIAPLTFFGLAILTNKDRIIPKHLAKKTIAKMVVWFVFAVFTFFALWPSMWLHPIQTLDYVFIKGVKEVGLEGGHAQLFFGKLTENPGLLFYPLVFLFKISPIYLLALVSFILFQLKRYRREQIQGYKKFFLVVGVFALGYLVEIIIPSKKLDRYILPFISYLGLIFAFGLTWLFFTVLPKLLRLNAHKHRVFNFITSLIFVLLIAAQILSLSPDYFSYYNPLFGGMRKGIYVIEPKWLIGQKQIENFTHQIMIDQQIKPFLESQNVTSRQIDPDEMLLIGFQEKHYTQLWPFVSRQGARAVIEDLTPQAKQARYFIYPVWDDIAKNETRFKLQFDQQIYLRNVPLYNVYKML